MVEAEFSKRALFSLKIRKSGGGFLMLYHKTTICNYFKTVRFSITRKHLLKATFSKGAHLKKKKIFLCSIMKQTLKVKVLNKILD